jgi:hypothetical protein
MAAAKSSRSASADVFVLLPGITGSVLRKDGKDLWALSGGAIGRGLLSLGDSIKQLTLNGDDPEAEDLGDGVTADRLIYGTTIIPKLWSIDGYGPIAARLRHEFKLTPGANFFEFPYDWRRDNRAAARRLQRLATGWLHAWQKKQNDPDARLVLVAHSMGGLISRYFIEVLGGWRITRHLVTLATPHCGSLNAVDFLANGYGPSVLGLRLLDLSQMLRSFTAVYQLLPIFPCIQAAKGKLACVSETDVPNIDRPRATAAGEIYREIKRAALENRNDPQYQAAFRITPLVGTFQPTSQIGRIEGKGVELLGKHPDHEMLGDGTVPQTSAYPIEWKNSNEGKVLYATQRHSAIQNGDDVLANLIGDLGAFDIDLGAYRGATALALGIPDLLSTAESVTCTVSSAVELQRLFVRVENLDTGAAVHESTVNARSALRREMMLTKLPAGSYRLTVRRPAVGKEDDVVSEVFLVM